MSFFILPNDKQSRVSVLPIARFDRKTSLPNIDVSYGIRKHDYGLICLKKDIQQLLLRQRHESIIIQKGC